VMIDGGKNGSNEPHPMGVSSQNIHPAPGMRTILGFGVGRIVPIRAWRVPTGSDRFCTAESSFFSRRSLWGRAAFPSRIESRTDVLAEDGRGAASL